MEGFRASFKAANGEAFPKDPRAEVIICSVCEGEADNEGLLKGMKETEGLLPTPRPPSAERRDDLDPCADRVFGRAFLSIISSGDSDPATRAARSADMGLEPLVDRADGTLTYCRMLGLDRGVRRPLAD